MIMDDIEKNILLPLQNFGNRWVGDAGNRNFSNLVNTILDQVAYDIDVYTLARNIIDEIRDFRG